MQPELAYSTSTQEDPVVGSWPSENDSVPTEPKFRDTSTVNVIALPVLRGSAASEDGYHTTSAPGRKLTGPKLDIETAQQMAEELNTERLQLRKQGWNGVLTKAQKRRLRMIEWSLDRLEYQYLGGKQTEQFYESLIHHNVEITDAINRLTSYIHSSRKNR